MDKVLVPFLTADDDRQRQQHLDELLTLRAAPLIRGVLLRRLGFYVSAQGANDNNPDGEDLYQEAMMRVVRELHQLRLSKGANIENFEFYVSRIATNLCIDFLRAHSPGRTRLKYSVRDLLRRHKDLVSWEYQGELLCGFAVWRNTGKSAFADKSSQNLEADLDSFESLRFPNQDVRLAAVSQIVAELFDWIGGPVEIDALVRMLAHLLEIKDEQIELDSPSRDSWNAYFVNGIQSGQSHVEVNELLARLWQSVMQLPAEQRDSFALAFQDQAGQDLFTVLLAADIVNWDELAEGMGRTVQEVVRLRLLMPMNSAGVAAELRASRDNVYKWRFRAIRRLQNDLK